MYPVSNLKRLILSFLSILLKEDFCVFLLFQVLPVRDVCTKQEGSYA